MNKKIEKLDYSKQTEVLDIMEEHAPIITKVNELAEVFNEHSRELIRLHARITDLPKEDKMSKKKSIKYKTRKCYKCDGLGIYEGYSGYDHKCDHCYGTGKIREIVK